MCACIQIWLATLFAPKYVRPGFGHRIFYLPKILLPFSFTQIKTEIDIMTYIAWQQLIQRDASHVGQIFGVNLLICPGIFCASAATASNTGRS
jgi:hypothetical protein